MNHNPILSVIVPVYNSNNYLPQCLDSIIASISGCLVEIEIILVDDGSTDGSSDTCDFYTHNYPFVRCIHQKNAGVSAARNVGLQLAEGNYIAWVDSDDTVTEDWFTQIYDAIVHGAPDVIVFDSLRLEGDRLIPEQYGRTGGTVARQTILDDIARDIRMLSGLPNKVIKAVCYCGVYFGNEAILEDYNHLFSILDTAKTFTYIPQFLYIYRQREDSIIHSCTPEQSFFCVNAAIRRKQTLYPNYQIAATTGIAVQMVLFCRARAYDRRYQSYQKEYDFCVDYIRQHIKELLGDYETPVRWKLKFVLLCTGMLPSVVKIKKFRRREK